MTPSPIGASQYRRTVVDTAIGDPVTADLCEQLDLSAFADQVQPYADQPLSSCDLFATVESPQVQPEDEPTHDVFVNTLRVGELYDGTGAKTSTESGLRVITYAMLDGHCTRDVIARG